MGICRLLERLYLTMTKGALGLVPSATSQSGLALPIIDPLSRRLGRLKRVVQTAARLHEQEAGSDSKCLMVTLTYRDEVEWEPRHIATFIECVRLWHRKHDKRVRYVWVLEKTKRGRPHYHVLFWVPRGMHLPQADKEGWWSYGLTRTERAYRAVGYIAKYASKAQESYKVKGARLYGVGGLNSRSARDVLHFWRLSRWLRDRIQEGERVNRVSFVGWVHATTGEIFRSPWAVVVVGGLLRLLPRP